MFVTLNVRIYPTRDSALIHKVHTVYTAANAPRRMRAHFTRLLNQYSRQYPNAYSLEITTEQEPELDKKGE